MTHPCRYDKPSSDNLGTETDSAVNQKVYYHRLGTEQDTDPCLFAEPAHPTWLFGCSATSDGRWMWLSVSDGCAPANLAFILDLSSIPRDDSGALKFGDYSPADTGIGGAPAAAVDGKPRLPVKRLVSTFAARWTLQAVDGARLTLMTNAQAPRNRIVAIDAEAAGTDALSAGQFREVVPQDATDILEVCSCVHADDPAVQSFCPDKWKVACIPVAHGGGPEPALWTSGPFKLAVNLRDGAGLSFSLFLPFPPVASELPAGSEPPPEWLWGGPV